MTYLNKDSAQQLLNTRPQGTSVQDALKALSDKGFTIEGYNDGSKGSINETKSNQFISNIKQDISKRISNIEQGIKEIPQAYKQETDSKLAGAVGAGLKLAQQPLNVAGQVVGATFDIAEKGIGEVIPEKVKQDVGGDIKKLASSKLGQKITSDLSSDWEKFKTTKLGQSILSNPDIVRAIENTVNVASVIQAEKVVETGVNVAKPIVKEGISTAKKVTSDVEKILSETAPKIPKIKSTKLSSDIMNKVARVNPVDANKFKQTAGESIGEYLTRTGNFGNPDKIIETEAKRFTQALKVKDEALASLPGTYKDGSIQDALKGLLEKAKATSGENIKSPYLKTVTELQNKIKTDGLTMEEINNLKRLYEKEMKLGYNKTLNPDTVKKATYIDDAIRTFQDETAKQLGFENLPELSKQIQTSKSIINSLGKKMVSNDLLNGVSLTDYITLSGGNPTNVGMYLTKKLFSDKTVQAKLAKMLANDSVPLEIKAILNTGKNTTKKIIKK